MELNKNIFISEIEECSSQYSLNLGDLLKDVLALGKSPANLISYDSLTHARDFGIDSHLAPSFSKNNVEVTQCWSIREFAESLRDYVSKNIESCVPENDMLITFSDIQFPLTDIQDTLRYLHQMYPSLHPLVLNHPLINAKSQINKKYCHPELPFTTNLSLLALKCLLQTNLSSVLIGTLVLWRSGKSHDPNTDLCDKSLFKEYLRKFPLLPCSTNGNVSNYVCLIGLNNEITDSDISFFFAAKDYSVIICRQNSCFCFILFDASQDVENFCTSYETIMLRGYEIAIFAPSSWSKFFDSIDCPNLFEYFEDDEVMLQQALALSMETPPNLETSSDHLHEFRNASIYPFCSFGVFMFPKPLTEVTNHKFSISNLLRYLFFSMSLRCDNITGHDPLASMSSSSSLRPKSFSSEFSGMVFDSSRTTFLLIFAFLKELISEIDSVVLSELSDEHCLDRIEQLCQYLVVILRCLQGIFSQVELRGDLNLDSDFFLDINASNYNPDLLYYILSISSGEIRHLVPKYFPNMSINDIFSNMMHRFSDNTRIICCRHSLIMEALLVFSRGFSLFIRNDNVRHFIFCDLLAVCPSLDKSHSEFSLLSLPVGSLFPAFYYNQALLCMIGKYGSYSLDFCTMCALSTKLPNDSHFSSMEVQFSDFTESRNTVFKNSALDSILNRISNLDLSSYCSFRLLDDRNFRFENELFYGEINLLLKLQKRAFSSIFLPLSTVLQKKFVFPKTKNLQISRDGSSVSTTSSKWHTSIMSASITTNSGVYEIVFEVQCGTLDDVVIGFVEGENIQLADNCFRLGDNSSSWGFVSKKGVLHDKVLSSLESVPEQSSLTLIFRYDSCRGFVSFSDSCNVVHSLSVNIPALSPAVSVKSINSRVVIQRFGHDSASSSPRYYPLLSYLSYSKELLQVCFSKFGDFNCPQFARHPLFSTILAAFLSSYLLTEAKDHRMSLLSFQLASYIFALSKKFASYSDSCQRPLIFPEMSGLWVLGQISKFPVSIENSDVNVKFLVSGSKLNCKVSDPTIQCTGLQNGSSVQFQISKGSSSSFSLFSYRISLCGSRVFSENSTAKSSILIGEKITFDADYFKLLSLQEIGFNVLFRLTVLTFSVYRKIAHAFFFGLSKISSSGNLEESSSQVSSLSDHELEKLYRLSCISNGLEDSSACSYKDTFEYYFSFSSISDGEVFNGTTHLSSCLHLFCSSWLKSTFLFPASHENLSDRMKEFFSCSEGMWLDSVLCNDLSNSVLIRRLVKSEIHNKVRIGIIAAILRHSCVFELACDFSKTRDYSSRKYLYEILLSVWRLSHDAFQILSRIRQETEGTDISFFAPILEKLDIILETLPSSHGSMVYEKIMSSAVDSNSEIIDLIGKVVSDIKVFLLSSVYASQVRVFLRSKIISKYQMMIGVKMLKLLLDRHNTLFDFPQLSNSSLVLVALDDVQVILQATKGLYIDDLSLSYICSQFYNDLESLLEYNISSLQKSTWLGDVDNQILALSNWAFPIVPCQHSFLSHLSIFKKFQQILHDIRFSSSDTNEEICGLVSSTVRDRKQKLSSILMKIVFSLASQIASVRNVEMSSRSLRKLPSGPNTLSNSIFDLFYSELFSSFQILVRACIIGTDTKLTNIVEIESYISRIISLIYSISNSPSCKKYICVSKWICLLVFAVGFGSIAVQRRVFKLVRRLLSNIAPEDFVGSIPQFFGSRDDFLSTPEPYSEEEWKFLDSDLVPASHRLVAFFLQAISCNFSSDSMFSPIYQYLRSSNTLSFISAESLFVLQALQGIPSWCFVMMNHYFDVLDTGCGLPNPSVLACLGGYFYRFRLGGTVLVCPGILTQGVEGIAAKIAGSSHSCGMIIGFPADDDYVEVIFIERGVQSIKANNEEVLHQVATISSLYSSKGLKLRRVDVVPTYDAIPLPSSVSSCVLRKIMSLVDLGLVYHDLFKNSSVSKLDDTKWILSLLKFLSVISLDNGHIVDLHNENKNLFSKLLKFGTYHQNPRNISSLESLENEWALFCDKSIRDNSNKGSSDQSPSSYDQGSSKSRHSRIDGISQLDNRIIRSNAIDLMVATGLPQDWCESSLRRCNFNVELALNFCFENFDQMPLIVAQDSFRREDTKPNENRSKRKYSSETTLQASLENMGFSKSWSQQAISHANSMESAISWILCNHDILQGSHLSEVLELYDSDSMDDTPCPLVSVGGTTNISKQFLCSRDSSPGFPSIGCYDFPVHSGKWYYEVTLFSADCIQIGWADLLFNPLACEAHGVGDCAHSWAFDGYRVLLWNGDSTPWGCKWSTGDTIGCCIDIDSRTMSFFLNGFSESVNMGLAFTNFDFVGGLFPCISMTKRQKLRINLGQSSFRYPAPIGYSSYLSAISSSVSSFRSERNKLDSCRDCFSRRLFENIFPPTKNLFNDSSLFVQTPQYPVNLNKNDEGYFVELASNLGMSYGCIICVNILISLPVQSYDTMVDIVNSLEDPEDMINLISIIRYSSFVTSRTEIQLHSLSLLSNNQKLPENLGHAASFGGCFLLERVFDGITCILLNSSQFLSVFDIMLDFLSREIVLACQEESNLKWKCDVGTLPYVLVDDGSVRGTDNVPNIQFAVWITRVLMNVINCMKYDAKITSKWVNTILKIWSTGLKSAFVPVRMIACETLSSLMQYFKESGEKCTFLESIDVSMFDDSFRVRILKQIEDNLVSERCLFPLFSRYSQALVEFYATLSCYFGFESSCEDHKDPNMKIFTGRISCSESKSFCIDDKSVDRICIQPPLLPGHKVCRPKEFEIEENNNSSSLQIGTVISIIPWENMPSAGRLVRWDDDGCEEPISLDDNSNVFRAIFCEDKYVKIPRAVPLNNTSTSVQLNYGAVLRFSMFSMMLESESSNFEATIELSDFEASIRLLCTYCRSKSQIIMQEIALLSRSRVFGWELRHNSYSWKPGAKYVLDVFNRDGHLFLKGNVEVPFGDVTLNCVVDFQDMFLFRFDETWKASAITLSCDNLSATKDSGGTSQTMVYGDVGFSTGVYYWEFKVEITDQPGSIFVGICPKKSSSFSQDRSKSCSRWNGFGYTSSRVAYTTEEGFDRTAVYGVQFVAGDIIGVLLDIDRDVVSFFVDGMKFGEHLLQDLGVAFQGISSGTRKYFFPVVGLRSTDRVTIQQKWLSFPTYSPAYYLDMFLKSYRIFNDERPMLSDEILHHAWLDWDEWINSRSKILFRPRCHKEYCLKIDTSPMSCVVCSILLGMPFYLFPGDRIMFTKSSGRTLDRHEEATIVGSLNGMLWYRLETLSSSTSSDIANSVWMICSSDIEGILIVSRSKAIENLVPHAIINGPVPVLPCFQGRIIRTRHSVSLSMRNGLEIDFTDIVGSVGNEQTLFALETRVNASNIIRYKVIFEDSIGWISKRSRGNGDEIFIDEILSPFEGKTPIIEATIANSEKLGYKFDMTRYVDSLEHGIQYFKDMVQSLGGGHLLANGAILSYSPSDNISKSLSAVTFEEYRECLRSVMSDSLVSCLQHVSEFASALSSRLGCSPCNLSHVDIVTNYCGVCSDRCLTNTETVVLVRYHFLKVINDLVSKIFPLINLTLLEERISYSSSGRLEEIVCLKDSCNSRWLAPSFGRRLRQNNLLIFTQVKKTFFEQLLLLTTTPTSLHPEEYEDPQALKTISVNRIKASSSRLLSLATMNERWKLSVFGQLYKEIKDWSDTQFRRSHVCNGHGGQKRAFKVKFIGEGANDYGGPYRAIFEQIVNEAQCDGDKQIIPILLPSPNRSFQLGIDQDRFVLNPSQSLAPMTMELGQVFGKLLGLAVRNGLPLGLALSNLFWKPLVRQPVGADDLFATDAAFVKTLQSISEAGKRCHNGLIDRAELNRCCEHVTFSLRLNDGSQVELVPSGKDIPVNADNWHDFMTLAESVRLKESQNMLSAIRFGIGSVLPVGLFVIFQPKELEELFTGVGDLDLGVLQQITEYEGYSSDSAVIVMFWKVLESFTALERTQFLRFVWARSRAPSSPTDYPMNFKIVALIVPNSSSSPNSPDDFLPTAQTCFFQLSLPNYSNFDIMRSKLLYAITHSPNMDADVLLHSGEGWSDV